MLDVRTDWDILPNGYRKGVLRARVPEMGRSWQVIWICLHVHVGFLAALSCAEKERLEN